MSVITPQSPAELSASRALAKKATLHATRNGEIAFGAPVSSAQINATVAHFKGKDIVKTLRFKSAKQLGEFASGHIARTSLDKQTQLALSLNAKQIADALGVDANKFWTRKLATCAYTVQQSRKPSRSRKPVTQPETPQA